MSRNSKVDDNQNEFKKRVDDKDGKLESTPEIINQFGREQIIYDCQFCHKKVLTEIEHQSTWIGVGLSFILFIIFKIYSLPLIVMLIPLTQQTVHTCPNCLNKVGTRSFYDLISLSDNVITYKIGNFGIIITKKQILGIFIFLLFALIFYLFISSVNFTRGNFIKESWGDFKSECSSEKFAKNVEETEYYCNGKYKYSDVQWNGFIIRVDYNENFFARYRASFIIKMEENNSEEPDLYLKFTDYQYDENKHTIFNVARGDFVAFNATMLSVGNKDQIPILETFGFEKLGTKRLIINPHIHHNGRYSVPHETVIHKEDTVYREIPELVSDEEMKIDQKETYH